LRADSIHKADSVFRADSIQRVDSIKKIKAKKTVIVVPTGKPGQPLPSSPKSESWVFGYILILFALFIWSTSRSGSFIFESVKNYFQPKKRSSIFSKSTVFDSRYRSFFVLFAIGAISLYIYFLLYVPEKNFTFPTFIKIFGLTAIFVFVKSLFIDLIGYVFLDKSTTKIAKESYFDVISFLGITLFPLLIIQIYSFRAVYPIAGIASLLLCIIAVNMIIIKIFRIFFRKIISFFYIMLYLCTLEILPLIGLFHLYGLII
jgi:hypothetical protein